MADSKMSPPRPKHDNVEDIHLLVVGCSGSGKSATGNSILLGNYFEESSQAVSTTRLPKTVTADPLQTGQRITVTDTPDISETWLNSDTIEGIHFLAQISPGPHAILVVISARMRISTEIEDKLKLLCNALGESVIRHMIIVFTSVDMLSRSSQSQELIKLDEYVSEVREKSSFVDSLLVKCRMRYIGFNNVINPLQYRHRARDQLDNLLTTVRGITQLNNFQRYEIEGRVETAMVLLDTKSGSRDMSRNKISELFGLVEQDENVGPTSLKIKFALGYVGLVGLVTVGAHIVGVLNPTIIIPGGIAIAYLGNKCHRQWKNNPYMKMKEAIETYQPKSEI